LGHFLSATRKADYRRSFFLLSLPSVAAGLKNLHIETAFSHLTLNDNDNDEDLDHLASAIPVARSGGGA
jgi:hypothetical protein